MNKKCELILKELENEGKLNVWWDFKFPKKEKLKLRLKDLLEEEVDEKYYLSDEQVKRIKLSTYNVSKTRIQEKDYCDTLCARDWKDPKCVRIGGIFDTENSKHQAGSIYDKEGLSPTLDIMQGGWRQPSIIEKKSAYERNFGSKGKLQNLDKECDTLQAAMGNGGGNIPIVEEPQIIKYDISQIVKVRKFSVDIEALKNTLRTAKLNADLNNNEIAEKLNLPKTQVEHWFRTDNCFSIPAPEIWLKLKEMLGITTNEFDESIMTFEEKEGVYEKANRIYDEKGIAPTLTQQEEKILTNIKIRKLTPKECWRLMGFDDESFLRAKNVPMSNTQLYKQARKFNRCRCFI